VQEAQAAKGKSRLINLAAYNVHKIRFDVAIESNLRLGEKIFSSCSFGNLTKRVGLGVCWLSW
jgi:hypothetical protein